MDVSPTKARTEYGVKTYAPVTERDERRHHYETDIEEGNQGAGRNKDQRQVSVSLKRNTGTLATQSEMQQQKQ